MSWPLNKLLGGLPATLMRFIAW